MEINFEDALKKSFTVWVRDGRIWKYILATYAVQIIFFALIFGLLVAFFGPIVSQVLSDPAKLEDVNFITQLIPDLVANILAFIVILVPLLILFSLVASYFYVLMQVRALQLNGLDTAKFTIGKYLRLVVLWFYLLFVALFSIYNKTLMIVSIVFYAIAGLTIVLFIASPVIGAVLALIWLVLLFPYLIILLYTSFRISLSAPIFLHKEIPITQAPKESYQLTKGNLISMFALYLIADIIIGVISAIVQLVGQGFGWVLDLATGTAFLSPAFAVLFSFIADPILSMVFIALVPAIYVQLIGGAGQMNAQMQDSSPPSMPVQKSWPPKRQAV